MRKNTRKWR